MVKKVIAIRINPILIKQIDKIAKSQENKKTRSAMAELLINEAILKRELENK